MPNFEIVQLSPDDWQVYKQIRLEALQTEPQAFAADYQKTAARPDAYWQGRLVDAASRKNNWLLFAREDGRLLGMIGAMVEDVPHVAWIISVYVSPPARGQGVGKALMSAILSELAQSGSIRTAKLSVNIHQKPALNLYQRCGFVITGTEDVFLGDGQYHPEYVMVRPIRPKDR